MLLLQELGFSPQHPQDFPEAHSRYADSPVHQPERNSKRRRTKSRKHETLSSIAAEHTFNLSTREAEAGDLCVSGMPGLHTAVAQAAHTFLTSELFVFTFLKFSREGVSFYIV